MRILLACLLCAGAWGQSLAPLNENGEPEGALSLAALRRPRPKPAFDLTGTWQHAAGPGNPFQFAPPPGAKLTPAAQAHYDAARKAQAEGKAYRDDIGQCWPAGMPIIMTRVWPILMMQNQTMIVMISGFMNSVRLIYLDGRQHTDPDIIIPSFNGESIGHWEGDTLVIDTVGFVDHHHWIDTGVPASDALHLVERIRLLNNNTVMEIETTATDPKMWEGEWKWTKRFRRVDDLEITEAVCLPNLNEHMLSTGGAQNVR
jgi:hypothetical protein